MDISRLFNGILLLTALVLATRMVVQVDEWRSAVSALNLRWEREQRQAGANGVSLSQRQRAQTEFEQLVANRPMRMLWLHLVLVAAAAGLALALAWRVDDLRFVGLWLASPIGLMTIAVLGFGWLLVSQANDKLAATSASLYGPPPPRVKVRTIQAVESEMS